MRSSANKLTGGESLLRGDALSFGVERKSPGASYSVSWGPPVWQCQGPGCGTRGAVRPPAYLQTGLACSVSNSVTPRETKHS